MFLSADTGVAIVIMDKDMYIEKCTALLNDEEVQKEYRDHTKSIHSKVVKHLLDLKLQLDTNSSNRRGNFTLQVTTASMQDSMVCEKYTRPTSHSGPWYLHVTCPYRLVKFLTKIF